MKSIDVSGIQWVKSSYSGGNEGECLEVADHIPGIVPVRDSKNPRGPVLLFPTAAWTAFITGVQDSPA
ncbi:DUF397 domain-containing protein [Streptomyces syringium]|uniref:DUF397 domain-containing protein n=1 Tax=Streptomyces syringium TaxID=76729 RepID=UPI0034518668